MKPLSPEFGQKRLSPTLDKLQQPLRGYKRRSESRSASGMLEVGDEVSPAKRSSSFALCTKRGPIQGKASACGETRTPNYGTVQLLGKQIYMVKYVVEPITLASEKSKGCLD